MTDTALTRKAMNSVPDNWQTTLTTVCNLVAPVWPLDQWIAVNPFWGLKHLPAPWADSLIRQRGGFSILPPKAFYQRAWAGGRILAEDLEACLAEDGMGGQFDALVSWLDTAPPEPEWTPRSVMADYPSTLDGEHVLSRVSDQIARCCAAFFDQRQSRWSAADASNSLFQFWLETSRAELALGRSTGVKGVRRFLASVPDSTDEAAQMAIHQLGVSDENLEALAHGWLLRLNGWASWCRGEDWRADLEDQTSRRLMELITVVLVWEAAALDSASVDQRAQWMRRRSGPTAPKAPPERLWIWHRAYERGFQRLFLERLVDAKAPAPAANETAVQAVFCIDVRSEVLRRHLEQAHESVQTLGFAGFFGLPIEHQKLGPVERVRQLPGLLKAPYRLADSQGSLRADRQAHQALDQKEIARSSVRSAKYSSLSTFTLVETTGLAWAWKLVKDSLKKPVSASSNSVAERRLVHRISGDPLTDGEKADAVVGMLKGMSLTRQFAPLVAFVGHGSRTSNNPHHAGLECGACGGKSGGVNARLAASLFNDPAVRIKVAERGIRIPDFTWAIAAEHCTLTDEVNILDEDQVPETHLPRLSEFRQALEVAGRATRRERATPLGLNGQSDEQLAASLNERGDDWAEVRPEWGLANNGAIVFAPRHRTRGANLGGRAFLHEYDPSMDDAGEVLTALMTAPMVVANWINLQYFASVAAPNEYGAGNKLLHSVVGGNVGVIEGNSPQLRIGLPLQSVHDGEKWRHEPVRLTVLIDAPAERIEAVMHEQRVVGELVDNRWLSLCRFSETGVERYQDGQWLGMDVKPAERDNE